VRLNRPEALNAVTPEMDRLLADAWAEINGDPEIWVAINVRLVNPTSRDVVAQTSFERRERASANDVPSIISAFDEALGGVMKQIVVWTVTNPALSVKRS